MNISNVSRKIIYLMVENGLGAAGFIKIYRKYNNDIYRTLQHFLKYKNLKLEIKTGSDDNGYDKEKHNSYQKIIEFILKNQIGLLEISNKNYPDILKQIYSPPPLLFFKGDKIKNPGLMVAIVGSRKCTDYGREVAEYMSRNLSSIGITVVSGMAAGIDSYAHRAAIKEAGGSIGVLGCGIDVVYPPENKFLFDDILNNGSIITEFLPGTRPLKFNFPIRNRIISGLSEGVVVIEAGERSGAIITCEMALRQNREVMAVPGSIFSPMNRGCHKLIKEGAKLVENIDDILDEFSKYKDKIFKLDKTPDNIYNKNTKCSLKLSVDNKKIYEIIGYKSKSVEEIVKCSGLEVKDVLKIIASLEMDGLIREESFNKYIRLF
jgi:DNA processing protein